ncbi:MAG: hypothetical protein ACPIOQ_53765, partial [Promethearchaeia archaeon]
MPPAPRLNGREVWGAAAARSLLAFAVAAAVVLGTAAAERTRPIGACGSGGAARCCTWGWLGSLPKEGSCATTGEELNFCIKAFVNVENGTLDALPKWRRVRSRSLGLQSDGVVIGGKVVALALTLASTSPQLDSTAGRSPQTARRSHEAADRKHSEVRLPTDARDEPDGLLRHDVMLLMWHNALTIGNTDTCNVCDGLAKELEDIDSHGNAFLTAANVTVTTATKFVNADSSASSLGAEALTTNIDIRDVVLKTSSSKGDSISCQGVPVLQAEDDTDLAPPSGSFATSDDVCLLPTTKPKALLADDARSIHGDAASGAQAHATPETWKVIDATVTLTILRALSLLTGDRSLTSFNHQALWSAAHPCGRQGGCFSHSPLNRPCACPFAATTFSSFCVRFACMHCLVSSSSSNG